MTERDRLIERLSIMEEMVVDPKADFKIGDVESVLRQARKMLEKAIVPPCKVGDSVYWFSMNGAMREAKVTGFGFDSRLTNATDIDYCISFNKIGKTVFLTREEAEKSLVNCESSKSKKQRKEDEGK